mmetsp:Transcript_24742/g.69275  ORF Transcript_24742/g.69275 Transcript_24742/m.69275 type:complete len:106 (-) Transcript_24742:219-536(-)
MAEDCHVRSVLSYHDVRRGLQGLAIRSPLPLLPSVPLVGNGEEGEVGLRTCTLGDARATGVWRGGGTIGNTMLFFGERGERGEALEWDGEGGQFGAQYALWGFVL